jgi:hypothetical protein
MRERHAFLMVNHEESEQNFFLSFFLQVDKTEWEAFLEKLSELEKKYQVILHELDIAQSRLHALDNSQKRKGEDVANMARPEKAQV